MFAIIVLVACVGWAAAAPATGTCMCVTGTTVNVRNAGSLSGHVVASVHKGDCYKFGGGVHTADGYTWYTLQNVHGHSLVWIASNYLHASPASSCSGTATGTATGSFATGIVSQHCLQCLCVAISTSTFGLGGYGLNTHNLSDPVPKICKQESGCKPIGCHFDVNSDSCGYFQIKQGYWTDCGSPGTSWHQCANDLHCSSQCVQNYMKRYASHYNCPMTCEGFAREHNGGPNGCHHSATLGYWHGVQTHSGCANVH